MSIYLYSIVEEDKINCGVCHKVMEDDATTDDYVFAWDELVHTDCCSDCYEKVMIKKEIN